MGKSSDLGKMWAALFRLRSVIQAHTLYPALSEATKMAWVTSARNVSALILVLIVARGAFLIDPRFTVLLLPPFLVYYTQEHPGWYNELPVVRYIANMFGNIQSTFGDWGFRLFMVIAGLLGGYFFSRMM